MDCLHEDAVYSLEFKRYSDEKGIPRMFKADLTIYCQHCGVQFRFSEPTISPDGLILGATIEPDVRISDCLDLKDLFLDRKGGTEET